MVVLKLHVPHILPALAPAVGPSTAAFVVIKSNYS